MCCVLLSVSQHEGRCRWLKDDKLLRELEGDSVDSEILDEELRSIELREPNTWVIIIIIIINNNNKSGNGLDVANSNQRQYGASN